MTGGQVSFRPYVELSSKDETSLVVTEILGDGSQQMHEQRNTSATNEKGLQRCATKDGHTRIPVNKHFQTN